MRCLSFILFFINLLAYTNVTGQTVPPVDVNIEADTTYQAAYDKLKKLLINKIHSPTHLKSSTLIKAYAKKWKKAYDGTIKDFSKDPSMLPWLKNWQMTEFNSY